jgi:hypothetical protein
MSKIIKMTNTSEVIVPVQVAENLTVQVPPKATLRNVEVMNLPVVKKYFKVTEDLTEVGQTKRGKTNLNEG